MYEWASQCTLADIFLSDDTYHIYETVEPTSYSYVLNRDNVIEFSVQSCSEVSIDILTQERIIYTVLIGGAANSQIAIRRGEQEINAYVRSIPDVLSCIEPRAFWIKCDERGVIQMGRGGHPADRILYWADIYLPLYYVDGFTFTGVGSWWTVNKDQGNR